MTKFEIKNGKNGLTLSINDGEDTETIVYQEPEYLPERAEYDLFQEFLFNILNDYGPSSSRYSKYRLKIVLDHGDKYDCNDTNCEICKSKK
ncbi:MAG: hypothetical protein V1647_01430 [Pseudomonadota bacterium]